MTPDLHRPAARRRHHAAATRGLLALLILGGCSISRPADSPADPHSVRRGPAASDLASERPRQPPGVALELDTNLPAATDHVDATSGVAVLREALTLAAVEPVIERFAQAVASEDLNALRTILAESMSRAATRNQQPMISVLQQQFRMYDFGKLQGTHFLRTSEARYGTPALLSGELAFEPGDLAVRIAIDLPPTVVEPLLGGYVEFVFRRVGDRVALLFARLD